MSKHEGNMEEEFQAAYDSLNDAQKQAVDTIEGPVMVIAGPGTGKTQILTLRIANLLLQADTQPENILALTFTESATKAMRERLRRYIGAAAYRVPIHTFHGFAGMLIARYPDAFPQIIGGQPATDLEKVRLLETVLQNPQYKKLRPAGNPSYYVKPILQIISHLKQESILPDDLRRIIDQQTAALQGTQKLHEKGAHKGKVRGEYHKLELSIEKNCELLDVYRSYESLLREEQRYDFDDMLLSTVAALRQDEAMLRDLQETYQYLLADEHQDVNGAQNELLELLASYHEQPNIFTVGDEKQAIYRFQGASLENFLFFEERFPGTVTIALTENYRSGQPILNAAHSLVEVAAGPLKDLRVPLTATAVKNAMVNVSRFSHQAVEDDFLIEEIKRQIAIGTPAQEMAVIVRTNREVEQFANALRQAGVPARASAESDILEHPMLRTIEELMSAAAAPEREEAIFALLHAPYWGIGGGDLARLLASRSSSQPLAALMADSDLLRECKIEQPEAVLRVHEVLQAAREKSTFQAPHQVVAYLIEESGLLDHLATEAPLESARVVRRLYDEIENLVSTGTVRSLVDILRELSLRRTYGLPLSAPFINTVSEAVSVMTAHKSKGLEFSVVFVPHLTDNLWGSSPNRQAFSIPLTKLQHDETEARLDDERRLLYVAMTRAKKELHLSYSSENMTGRELVPSRLLSDIDETLLTPVDVASFETEFAPLSGLTPVANTRMDPAVFIELFKARGFSATSINNCLDSPWQYIYRNLLRIPQVQSLPLLYGTAVHNVIQQITAGHTKSGVWCPAGDLPQRLRQELDRLPLSATDASRLHEKGIACLTSYLDHLKTTTPAVTKEEFTLTLMFQTGIPELPEIPLTGKLDRLDFNAEGKVVRVVDYKTGKARSRNDIEGKTKTSRGHYKRQLVFYALLLSLYEDERYQCREGVLSFVEPDKHGVIREEAFTIMDEEIAELKKEIIESTKVILSGEFGKCDSELCDYCHLVERWGKYEK